MTPNQLKKKREVWSRKQIRGALNWFRCVSRYFFKMSHITIKTDKNGDHILSFESTADSDPSGSYYKIYSFVVFNEKEDLNEMEIKNKIYSIFMDFMDNKVNLIKKYYFLDDNSYYYAYPDTPGSKYYKPKPQ